MPPRRGARRHRKRVGRKSAMKSASPSLYKAVKAVAHLEALKSQETKYEASYSPDPVIAGTTQNIYNQLISKMVAGNINYLQPAGLQYYFPDERSTALLLR